MRCDTGGAHVFRVRRVDAVPDDIVTLSQPARAETFGAIDRLIADYASEVNRFDAEGEALFEARVGVRLAGVGGLNVDPYAGDGSVGRVRRLYVHPDHRRLGIGRALVAAIERAAQPAFAEMRLFTPDAAAAAFYARLGFRECTDRPKTSHVKTLRG